VSRKHQIIRDLVINYRVLVNPDYITGSFENLQYLSIQNLI